MFLKFEDDMKINQVIHIEYFFNLILFQGDEFVNTTINWLTWMPHIRILDIDNELLSQLILNNFRLEKLLFLEILIIHQLNNSLNNQLLTIVNRLGRSSSIHTIHLQEYRISLHLTIDDLYLLLHEIFHNFHRLKVMIIEFHQDTPFDSQILEKLTDIQKKNSYLDYIHISNTYIELCFVQQAEL